MSQLISMPRNHCCTVNPSWTSKTHLPQFLSCQAVWFWGPSYMPSCLVQVLALIPLSRQTLSYTIRRSFSINRPYGTFHGHRGAHLSTSSQVILTNTLPLIYPELSGFEAPDTRLNTSTQPDNVWLEEVLVLIDHMGHFMDIEELTSLHHPKSY